MASDRSKHVERFYELLKELEERVGGKRTLADFDTNMNWPARGVYFFFEDGEFRTNSTSELRVVRVGTHALRPKSWTRLAHRLHEHKEDFGRSVFRDQIRTALKNRAKSQGSWNVHRHETCVSTYIENMPFLWLKVEGKNGPTIRAQIERNSIGLLSFWRKDAVGRPSDNWLGKWRNHKLNKVEKSGLWNVNFVTKGYEASFLEDLTQFVDDTQPLKRREESWDDPMCITKVTS